MLGRSSKTEKLYDASKNSMDEIGAFEPFETGRFIKVQAIRLKKYVSSSYDVIRDDCSCCGKIEVPPNNR